MECMGVTVLLFVVMERRRLELGLEESILHTTLLGYDFNCRYLLLLFVGLLGAFWTVLPRPFTGRV